MKKRSHNFIDRSGLRFGKLTIVEEVGLNRYKKSQWLCRCDCGNTCISLWNQLQSGLKESCGCYQKESARKRFTTHGESVHSGNSTEYSSWICMKTRCLNPNSEKYKIYGGRGIKICSRWVDSFENFLSDMGRKPTKKHSIERINNDGNYEPSNCKWGTDLEQANNKRLNIFIVIGGIRKTAAQWGRQMGFPKSFVTNRIKAGWNPIDAVNTPALR